MASVYIQGVNGGETTTPTGEEGIELDDATTSTWIKIKNLIGRKLRETGGTTLSMGAVADGEFLKRSGTSIIGGTGGGGGDWTSSAATWTYSSADSPVFVISINADVTGVLQTGMRIKLTQTTAKYFIIHAVGTWSGSATLITVYGGTDYTLANAAITSPYYSSVKSPFGFPMAKSKWTVTALNDSTNRAQASPVSGTIYNLGSLSLSIPIGEWDLEWKVTADVARGADGGCTHYTSLSTANNTINTAIFGVVGATGVTEAFTSLCVTTRLAVASKTTYYVTAKTVDSSVSSITHYNSAVQPCTVYLTDVYL